MRSAFDFSSWTGIGSTLLGLVLVTLVAVGIRLVFMQTLQRRRERQNRQINERLKTLIAAYKTLGGSFTGNLEVHSTHGRGAGMASPQPDPDPEGDEAVAAVLPVQRALSESIAERRRRIRDAVEAALADIMLLGTEEQVRMAAQAAQDMVAGRVVLVGPLVTSLRDFIRQALDLAPIPDDLVVPAQGPVRPVVSGGGRGGAGGNAGGGRGGAGGGGGGGAMAGGAGMGAGLGLAGAHRASADDVPGASTGL